MAQSGETTVQQFHYVNKYIYRNKVASMEKYENTAD